MADEVLTNIDEKVKNNKVMLYMKGTPDFPQCGFSGRAIAILDHLGATSMLTYPGDLSGRYDRRLEPLSQRAGAILHLSTERDRTGTLPARVFREADRIGLRFQTGDAIQVKGRTERFRGELGLERLVDLRLPAATVANPDRRPQGAAVALAALPEHEDRQDRHPRRTGQR